MLNKCHLPNILLTSPFSVIVVIDVFHGFKPETKRKINLFNINLTPHDFKHWL